MAATECRMRIQMFATRVMPRCAGMKSSQATRRAAEVRQLCNSITSSKEITGPENPTWAEHRTRSCVVLANAALC